MSIPDVFSDVIFSPDFSFSRVDNRYDEPLSVFAPRKYSVPTTLSVPRVSYGRRRSRHSQVGISVTTARSYRSSQRRTSLPAIHFHQTNVSTLHVDTGVSRERSGSIPEDIYRALHNFRFGAAQAESSNNELGDAVRASTPLEARMETRQSSVITVIGARSRRSVVSLQSATVNIPGATQERSKTDRRPSTDIERSPFLSTNGSDCARNGRRTPERRGSVQASLPLQTNILNTTADIWDPSTIFSMDEPVAVKNHTDMFLGPVMEGDREPFDTFMDHIRRVEDPNWTFTREEQHHSFSYLGEPQSGHSVEGSREGWWCEPLGRFVVCKIGTMEQSPSQLRIRYNRLKIRRYNLNEHQTVVGPPVLVHRHSKAEAFSIYRCFSGHMRSKTIDSSFSILLGTRKALRDCAGKRNHQFRVAKVALPISPVDSHLETKDSIPLHDMSKRMLVSTPSSPDLRLSEEPLFVTKSRPAAASPPRIDTNLGSKGKSIFRSLVEALSLRSPVSPTDESPSQNDQKKRELEQLIHCFTSVGLLPSSPKKKRPEEECPAMHGIPQEVMCMLLPLWPEQSDAQWPVAARSSRRSSKIGQFPSPQMLPPIDTTSTVPLEARKYLLVFYAPDLVKDQEPKKKARRKSKGNTEPSPRKNFGAFFSAYGRVLSYEDVRYAPLPIPERGLCVKTGTSIPLINSPAEDLTLALTTQEAGIMIYNDSFQELGLVDRSCETASEMGKAIAEMVWCGCIALMTFMS